MIVGSPLGDVGFDGQAILRRGVDDRDIARTDERHVEGAGDRSGGKRQAIDADLRIFLAAL